MTLRGGPSPSVILRDGIPSLARSPAPASPRSRGRGRPADPHRLLLTSASRSNPASTAVAAPGDHFRNTATAWPSAACPAGSNPAASRSSARWRAAGAEAPGAPEALHVLGALTADSSTARVAGHEGQDFQVVGGQPEPQAALGQVDPCPRVAPPRKGLRDADDHPARPTFRRLRRSCFCRRTRWPPRGTSPNTSGIVQPIVAGQICLPPPRVAAPRSEVAGQDEQVPGLEEDALRPAAVI